jgi:hypothetical protein
MEMTMTTVDKITDFHNYVASFYMPGRDPVYPFEDLTLVDIIAATQQHLDTTTIPFEGDSIDREAVAQILCDDFGYSYPE